jgi:hypothetical protein
MQWFNEAGGDAGIRTPCLLRAKQALSQVSYIPVGGASWTRTRDLSLIRTALSPPELMPRLPTIEERSSKAVNLVVGTRSMTVSLNDHATLFVLRDRST